MATQQKEAKLNPCANNCGFWGRSDTMNLCSKCYADYHQASVAKSAVGKSLAPETTHAAASAVESVIKLSSSLTLQDVAPPPQRVANRCRSCNKKVGMMGFKCRCGLTFCGSHRYAEKHDCTFDFKAVGRDAIAKENPVVKADKLERF